MKNLIDIINEDKAMFPMAQYETSKAGGYTTFNVSKEMKSYKFGFIVFNKDGEFVYIIAFNDSKEYCKEMGYDEDNLDFLKDAELYKSFEGEDGSQYMRIW